MCKWRQVYIKISAKQLEFSLVLTKNMDGHGIYSIDTDFAYL